MATEEVGACGSERWLKRKMVAAAKAVVESQQEAVGRVRKGTVAVGDCVAAGGGVGNHDNVVGSGRREQQPRFSLPSGRTPYSPVHTGPAADRYADWPLPGEEEEKKKKKKKKKRRRRRSTSRRPSGDSARGVAREPSPPVLPYRRRRPRVLFSPRGETERLPTRERIRGDQGPRLLQRVMAWLGAIAAASGEMGKTVAGLGLATVAGGREVRKMGVAAATWLSDSNKMRLQDDGGG
ncbi:hypothetical protein BHE74_00016562 [Ensete ventricosum]|nr:hypothetical protein BHE74_00016562 [Ensete ventricosum]